MRRFLLLLFILSSLSMSIYAQAPEFGRIALYADSLRTGSEVHQSVPYVPFDVYIFLQPGVNGMYCAEFALDSSTESMVIAGQDWHEGISVSLGELATGLSTCFLECQTDWVCLVHLSMIDTNIDPATLEVIRHPGVGYYQFANCEPDVAIEPVFIGPELCYNQGFVPDTDPPEPTSVTVDDDWHLYVHFSEKIFERDAVSHSNYHIYATDNPGDSLAVTFTQFQEGEDAVWLALDPPMTEGDYTIEFSDLRDITGNAAPPGTGITFHGFDTSPPELLAGYALDVTTVALLFSEKLGEGSAENLSNYDVGCPGCAVVPQPYAAVLQADGRTVHLSLDSQIIPDATYYVYVSGVQDYSGNSMKSTDQVSFSAADFSPPYVTDLSFASDTSLKVTWSEAVEQSSAENMSNYGLVDNGPPAADMTIDSAVLDEAGKIVRLGFTPPADPEKTYTLYVSGVADTSGMEMLPDSFLIVPLDTIPPHMISAGCNGLMQVDVVFSEQVDGGVDGHTEYFQLFPAAALGEPVGLTGVALTDGDTGASLYLAEELETELEYTVRAIGISDIAGNTAPLLERTFVCEDVYPPEVLELILPDLSHVNIQFSEIVNAAAGDPASYSINLSSDTTSTAAIDSVTIGGAGTRAGLALAAPLILGEMYTLRLSGIGDPAGNMIDQDSSWTFEARENIAPSLVNLSVTSDSIVHLEFDEPLDPVTAQDVSKYAVVEASDTSVHLPLQSAVLDGGTVVHLEVDGRAATDRAYTVWILGVTDPSGNELFTGSEEFAFIDDIAPHLLSAEGTSARSVLVYFDEAVSSSTARVEGNFILHIEGDPSSEVDVFQAERLPDQMSVKLVLGADLVNLASYTLKVSGIEDLAGNTIVPDSTGFQYSDDAAPVILEVDLINTHMLSITFNEPVDSMTAVDTGNYLIYVTSAPADQLAVTSIDWLGAEVRLDLAAEPAANLDHTVVVDGVEDRYGNACSGLEGHFTYTVYVSSAAMCLYADEYRTTNEIETGSIYEPFSFYVFVGPGGNGVFAAEYALSIPETYFSTGSALNPAWVATSLGDPYGGHSVALSMCANDWFWAVRVDCMTQYADEQEIVWIEPHPSTGAVQVATCLAGHPLEGVSQLQPLLINVQYVAVMVESWDASFRNGGVELRWSIAETKAEPAFEVSRSLEGTGSWRILPEGPVTGDGREYTVIDRDIEPGHSLRYRVSSVEEDGSRVLFETGAVAVPAMPLALRQNSPNPFNPSTSIGFYLPKPCHVRLEIFDLGGRQVDVLADGSMPAGEHSVEWDGRDRNGAGVSSGVYFYRLTAGKESLSRKMVLLR